MSSTINATYFGMTKIELNAIVVNGEPAEVNGAQAELDRRRANKAAKRAMRESKPITNYEQAFEEAQERDLVISREEETAQINARGEEVKEEAAN